MKRAQFLAAFVCLSVTALAQMKGHIEIQEDVAAGTSMQVYLDFSPASDVGGIPPLIPAPEDALIEVEPIATDTTSAGFGGILAGKFNDRFRLDGLGYKARFRAKDGDYFTYDTVTISSPVSLQALYISPNSGIPPSTLVTEGTGISFNPSFGNVTRRLENAYAGSPNAQLRVNDIDPALDPRHQVEVFAPGTLKFSFLSGTNVNQPIAFIMSNFYNPETIPQAFVSFPGSLDIGTHNGVSYQNVQAVADAITGSSGNPFLDQFFFTDQTGRMDFQVSLGPTARGTSIAVQAIIADPTQPAVNLAFTQAADINAAAGKEIVLPLTNDGGMQVNFETGTTFDFYGATYSGININENGFVTFGGAVPSGPMTAQIDPQLALGGPPAIFANWADWDTTGVGVTYREFGRELRISWGKAGTPISHGGLLDSGSFTLTLHLDVPAGTAPPSQRFAGDSAGSTASNAGSIFIDTGEFMSASTNLAFFDAVAGVSPGSVGMPMSVPNDSFALPFVPQAPNRPNLIQNNLSGSALSTLGLASGGVPFYRNGLALTRKTMAFFPLPVMTGTSYLSLRDDDQENDLQGADIQNISVSNVGMSSFNFRMVGYFRYLYSANAMAPGPVAELVDAATMTLVSPLGIVNVMSPNGAADAGTLIAAPTTIPPAPGFKPFEGATLQLPGGALSPALVGSNVAIRLTFSDGTSLVSRDSIAIVP